MPKVRTLPHCLTHRHWWQVNPRETTIFSKILPRNGPKGRSSGQGRVVRDETKKPKKLSLQEQMLAEAQSARSDGRTGTMSGSETLEVGGGAAVSIHNIVPVTSRAEDSEVRDLFGLEKVASPQEGSERKVRLIDELD
jgi:hypothetical protein